MAEEIRVPVPATFDHIRLEFPGYVGSTEGVEYALGGPQAIAKAQSLDANDNLTLRLRPASSTSHPLRSLRQPCCSLLLRVKVKKRKNPSSSGEADDADESKRVKVHGGKQNVVACTVLARASLSFSFSELADYQYIPELARESDDKITVRITDPLTNEDALREDFLTDKIPLDMAPTRFAEDFAPSAYRFHAPIMARRLPANNGPPIMEIRFSEKMPALPASVAKLPKEYESLRSQLQSLFHKRPIWSRLGLIAAVRSESWVTLRRVLYYVAYRFSNGAWRQMLVRHGYDPRQDPSSKIYQSINLRIQQQSNNAVVTPQANFIYSGDQVLPNCDHTYQLCEIHEATLQRMITEAPTLGTCCEKSGWVPEKTYIALRSYMKQQMLRNSRALASEDAEAAVKGLAGGRSGSGVNAARAGQNQSRKSLGKSGISVVQTAAAATAAATTSATAAAAATSTTAASSMHDSQDIFEQISLSAINSAEQFDILGGDEDDEDEDENENENENEDEEDAYGAEEEVGRDDEDDF